MPKLLRRVSAMADTNTTADTASCIVTEPLISSAPMVDSITAQGSIQGGTSGIFAQGSFSGDFIEGITTVFIRVFVTGIFTMGSVIGITTAFITEAFAFTLESGSNTVPNRSQLLCPTVRNRKL